VGIAGNDFWQNQDRPSIAAKARGTVDRRVLQNVRRRLNRFSQTLFLLIVCPQSLHVIKMLPAMFLVAMYMP
jgi:hypothetical protein